MVCQLVAKPYSGLVPLVGHNRNAVAVVVAAADIRLAAARTLAAAVATVVAVVDSRAVAVAADTERVDFRR